MAITELPEPDMQRRTLKGRFIDLWTRCLSSDRDCDPEAIWIALDRHYDEPHRHYHNQDHLLHCLCEFDAVRDRLQRPDEVEMAIWFHDVIYAPMGRENEANSVRFFEEVSCNHMRSEFVASVGDLIMVTTHRDPPESADQKYICDIDMSSFGTTWERFLTDSKNLKRESPAPDAEFYAGKCRFLRAILNRPRIFLTDYFYARYERQARGNIAYILSLIERNGTMETP